jgi:hypothetical protein
MEVDRKRCLWGVRGRGPGAARSTRSRGLADSGNRAGAWLSHLDRGYGFLRMWGCNMDLQQKAALGGAKGSTPSSHHARQAGLMNLKAIEKTLYDYDALPGCRGTMEIEEHQRFAKPCRKAILGIRPVHGPAGVSDQKTVFVMDRDNNTSLHGTKAAVVTRDTNRPCQNARRSGTSRIRMLLESG